MGGYTLNYEKRLLSVLIALCCYALCGTGGAKGADFPVKVNVPEGHGAVGAHLLITIANAEGEFMTHANAFRAPETVNMRFSSGKTLEMRVEADGYWSPPQLFISKTTDRPIEFSLLPTGMIQRRVLVEENETPPADVDVRFESSPDKGRGKKIRQSSISCPVTDGRFLCGLPAGVLDVRMKADGFIPQYLWGISVAEGKELDLGSFVLKRGGSVAGRVASDDRAESKKVEVKLQPMQASFETLYRARKRFDQLTISAAANVQGFFQLSDVPAGQYWLTAKQEDAGESFRFPVKVYKDTETIIEEPLVLRKPAALRVAIHPPLDYYNRPWMVELYQGRLTDAIFEPVAQGQCSKEGVWKRSGLQAGSYQLAVFDSKASGLAMESLEIDGEAGEIHDEQILIDMLPVAGRVLYGDEPLVAKLWFGGRSGTRSIEMATDVEGEFSGFLPELGEWVVEVSAEEPRLRYRRVLVEVEKRKGNSTAEAEIKFPAQLVEGEVVDAEEAPVSQAAVFLVKPTTLLGAPPQARTDDEGKFSFAGIDDGEYTLQAYRAEDEGQGMQPSSRETLNVLKAKSSPFVTLQFGRPRHIKGRVLSPNGRVPGASVVAQPASAAGPLGVLLTPLDQTDVDGRFSIPLPVDTAEVAMTVAPPGFCLTAMRREVQDDAEVTITVYDACGSLVLEDEDGLGIADFGRDLTIEQDGVALDLGALGRWVRHYGGEGPGGVRISQLALGHYKVCRKSLAQTPCVTGFVPVDGELRLDVSGKSKNDGA